MADQREWQEQTDAFEAYQIFQAVKNVFFWLLLLGLLVMQCAFWLTDQGVMDKILDTAPQLHSWAKSIIVFCYVSLSVSAVIYCLSLWTGLHLALVGRLSGLSNSSKAFFLSLIFLVFAVPWQRMFDWELPGVLFTYERLFEAYSKIRSDEDYFQRMLYYSRFVALWVVALMLLIAAQRYSTRASKMVRRSIARFAERGQTSANDKPTQIL